MSPLSSHAQVYNPVRCSSSAGNKFCTQDWLQWTWSRVPVFTRRCLVFSCIDQKLIFLWMKLKQVRKQFEGEGSSFVCLSVQTDRRSFQRMFYLSVSNMSLNITSRVCVHPFTFNLCGITLKSVLCHWVQQLFHVKLRASKIQDKQIQTEKNKVSRLYLILRYQVSLQEVLKHKNKP